MRFLRSLLWSGLIGSAVGLLLSAKKPTKKTVMVKQLSSTADDMLKSARKMRRRMMNRLRD